MRNTKNVNKSEPLIFGLNNETIPSKAKKGLPLTHTKKKSLFTISLTLSCPPPPQHPQSHTENIKIPYLGVILFLMLEGG